MERNNENYYLSFNRFESNLKQTWQELQMEKDLCDVTLACDGEQILTHKLIISCSSPVFKNILKQNSNPHPIIYLRGVSYKDLQNLLSYMYQGEVYVAKENLQSFLELAEDFKIQ